MLAKVAVSFTHNGQTFAINEIGSFAPDHFAKLKEQGYVTDDPADIAYGAQFGIKTAIDAVPPVDVSPPVPISPPGIKPPPPSDK